MGGCYEYDYTANLPPPKTRLQLPSYAPLLQLCIPRDVQVSFDYSNRKRANFFYLSNRASAAGVAPGYGHDPSDKAEWKQIQKRVFTSWCNEQLKEQDSPLTIEDLQKDFADGVRLIALVEALSQKKVGRYHKKPRMHAQKMENLEMVLKLLVDVETIPLVNIGKLYQV